VSVALTEMNIGIVYGQLGDNEKALFHFQKALAIQEVALGPSHASVAGTYVSMGTCLNSVGRYEEAREVYAKSLEINRACLGEDHTRTANSKWGLAEFWSILVITKQH
jgi:tetratricopeptide (TPR) repeat protein